MSDKDPQEKEAFEAAIASFMKPGNPGLKLKSEFDKACRALLLSKNQLDVIKTEVESKEDNKSYRDLCLRLEQGPFQILPHFFKLMISLRKQKKEFAIILHSKEARPELIAEFNLFCKGEHPLYNGKNGTPPVRFDGSKGCKDFVIAQTAVSFGQKGWVYGTSELRKGESSIK